MTSLAELFGEDRQKERAQTAGIDDANTESLADLLGPPPLRTAEAATHTAITQDTAQLTAIVDAAAANSSAIVAPASAAGAVMKRPRRERRFDALSLASAAIALVVVLATSAFVGVQIANASPAASALESLTAAEASLQNTEQEYTAALKRAETARQKALEDVARTQAALATMGDVVDGAALAAATQAGVDYRTALEAVTLATPPAPYMRGDIDEDSLVEVGEAINAAQARETGVEAEVEALREVRLAADALAKTYEDKLAAFGSQFMTFASTAVAAAPLAEPVFRDAVVAAGTAASTTPLGSAAGVTAMKTFRDAVLALRADETRAVEAAEQEERDRQENESSNSGGGSGPGEVANPPAEPTTPPAPTDPTDPPAPTDPVDPAPVDPPTDG